MAFFLCGLNSPLRIDLFFKKSNGAALVYLPKNLARKTQFVASALKPSEMMSLHLDIKGRNHAPEVSPESLDKPKIAADSRFVYLHQNGQLSTRQLFTIKQSEYASYAGLALKSALSVISPAPCRSLDCLIKGFRCPRHLFSLACCTLIVESVLESCHILGHYLHTYWRLLELEI